MATEGFNLTPLPLWIPALSCIQQWKKVCQCSNQPSLQTVILPSSAESDTASTMASSLPKIACQSRRENHQTAVCLNAPSWDSWLVFLNSRSLFLVCPLRCSPRFAQAGLPSTLPSLAPSPPCREKEHRVCRSLSVGSNGRGSFCVTGWYHDVYSIHKIYQYTSSTAQGGGGSFRNRKPIGDIGCCESGMAERIH